MTTLNVTTGPAAGRSVVVDRELVIGREGADLTIPDPEVSRRHTLVRPAEGGIEVEDLGSLNGTYLDGVRLGAVVTVTSRATIRVGRSQIVVELAAAPAPPEPAAPVSPPPQAPPPPEPAPRRGTVRRIE